MVRPAAFSERPCSLTVKDDYAVGEFLAMGCPCQVLMETTDAGLAEALLTKVRDEAWRIEARWSRYLPHSLVQQINADPEQTHELDGESAAVIDYCEELWRLSDGAFDITSGVLRQVWTFDGGSTVPSRAEIDAVMAYVGWHRVEWQNPRLTMQPHMEIDLGGVGKEYAVDLCAARLAQHAPVSCLVNFGGDCAVTRAPDHRDGWQVGIESVNARGQAGTAVMLSEGALATSGNSHRFVYADGKRLSHIMDARTGWPVEDAPHSVTVQASTCLQAGMFATLACLQGNGAAQLLADAELPHWLQSGPA